MKKYHTNYLNSLSVIIGALRPGFANMLPCHFLGDVPSGQETQALGKGRLLQRGGAGQEEDCDCGGVNNDDVRDVNEVSYFEAA